MLNEEKIHDPVCGMEIKDTIKAPANIYKGKTYFFCTELCKIQFEHNPDKYVKKDDRIKNPHHHP